MTHTDYKRYCKLVELEEKIRLAMLGESWETKIPMKKLRDSVVEEIKVYERSNLVKA